MDNCTAQCECQSADRAERRYPHRIAWRRLPLALVLRLESGAYVVDLRHERSTARAWDVVVIPPETEHRIHMPSPGVALVNYAHMAYTLEAGIDLFRVLRVPTVISGTRAGHMGECLRGLASCAAEPHGSLMRHAREQELGFRLLRYLIACGRFDPSHLQHPDRERLEAVLRHIDRHLSEPITRAMLASLANLSESRFHDVFKGVMGVAPLDYVQNRRMQLARKLLINSSLGVGQIAMRCGYEDPGYFSRLFRRTQGVAPGAFRTSVRESGF